MKKNKPTYLKTSDVPDYAPCGGEFLSINLDIYVNVKKLRESRNIFYDPETLVSGKDEFKKTFLVFGGISNQSVTNLKVS